MVGGERGSLLFSLVASTVVTLAARLRELGLPLPIGLTAEETLAAKLEETVPSKGSQVIRSTQFGAWTRNRSNRLGCFRLTAPRTRWCSFAIDRQMSLERL